MGKSKVLTLIIRKQIERHTILKDGIMKYPQQNTLLNWKEYLKIKSFGEQITLLNTCIKAQIGSGSIAIACHQMKRKLIGYEIDADYYRKACKRFEEQTRQTALW